VNSDAFFATLRSRLASHQPKRVALAGFRPAAVLVPVLDTPDGPQLLFTIRARLDRYTPSKFMMGA
jgi:hypothetical protein